MAEPAVGMGSGVDSRFDSLYRGHHREILAYFIRRIPRSDAEDAAADVFTVAWRRLDQIPKGDQAVGWLYGVAHKVLSNHWRAGRRALRLNRRLVGLGSPAPETPELQVVRSAEDQILIRALDRLRSSDREILKLASWEKLPHRSIGELLGISEAAVDQRISRARKRLAKLLERSESKPRSPVPLLRKKGGMT
jgi:RNA polymerase sigma-70 factor (ECF subfamily)